MTSSPPASTRRVKLGMLPPLKRGNSLEIVVANALVFVDAGWEKSRALGVALNLAGYKPPPPATCWDFSNWSSRSSTAQSTVH